MKRAGILRNFDFDVQNDVDRPILNLRLFLLSSAREPYPYTTEGGLSVCLWKRKVPGTNIRRRASTKVLQVVVVILRRYNYPNCAYIYDNR